MNGSNADVVGDSDGSGTDKAKTRSRSRVLYSPSYPGRTMDHTEGELIDRCLAGDQAAWGVVYRQYMPLVSVIVHRSSWRFTLEEREDLAQEIFIRVVKGLPNFRRESSLKTFLARIAYNHCVSALRRRLARKRDVEIRPLTVDRNGEEQPLEIGDPAVDLDRRLVEDEQRVEIAAALARMGEPCRKLIVARFWEEKSYEELAQAAASNTNTIGVRIMRCLKRFRAWVGKPAVG